MMTQTTQTIAILNGTVLDGTGTPPFKSDILIKNGQIETVGNLNLMENIQVLDAAGMMVCPGFIDAHTHSDAYILLEPSAPSKLYQGVTTEITGNCGVSCAPLYGQARMPSDWTVHTYPGQWQTVSDYRKLLEQVVPAPNIALLAGHNTLRAGVIGYNARAARPDEIQAMVQHLERALDEGARGLSTGLAYAPGRYAEFNEICELAKAVSRRKGIYTSHMRNETSRLTEAVTEALDIGRSSGVQIQISHLKAAGQKNWSLLEKAIALIEDARRQGIEVTADRYPYTASCTDLDIIFPDWAAGGGQEAILERLHHPAQRKRLLDELMSSHDDAYWKTITIGSTFHQDNLRFQGQPLTEVARVLNVNPAEAVLKLAETDRLRTAAFFQSMSEENMHRVLQQPWVMIGSDASLRAPEGVLSHDWPHPRAYGTFPRFLRMALDGATVPLPEAIRKITSLPARTFRLDRRGEIRPGYYADLLVIDPATLQDTSTFNRPHALAQGIRHVFVNGIHTLREGIITGQRGGRFL